MTLGLGILDVVIGITFVYLMLSLTCSALNELIEGFLKKRAANLARGIRELLNDPGGQGIVRELYEHPLIMSLYQGKYRPDNRNLPSYIPARNFTLALLDLVVPEADRDPAAASVHALRQALTNTQTLNPQVRRALLALTSTAGNDLPAVRAAMEDWYNTAMDRVSGWYRRYVQRVVLLLGLGLTIAINADTIAIVRSLANDPPMRNALIVTAQEYARAETPDQNGPASDRVAKNLTALQKLGLPIGWNNHPESVPANGKDWLMKGVGWLITALAISLGAPFWFDVLNKVMVVRSTVKPHEKSPEEASEDRQS